MEIPFVGGSYSGRSPTASPQECINLFFEPPAKGQIGSTGTLVSTPGSTVVANCSTVGPVRGMICINDDFIYAVVGNKVYKYILPEWKEIFIGTLAAGGSGHVRMAASPIEVAIATSVGGAIITLATDTVQEITDPDFDGVDAVAYLDGYFLWKVKDTGTTRGRFQWSNLFAGLIYLESDFATTLGDADELIDIVIERREVWLLSKKTLEIFYNSGDLDIPFQRFQGGITQTGIIALHCAARFDNSLMWVSSNSRGQAQVTRAGEGYQPSIVSTPEIAYRMSSKANPIPNFCYAYQSEGHEFFLINYSDEVLVYDALAQEWHVRAHNIDSVFPSRERYNCHVFDAKRNAHYLGDFENGSFYSLSTDEYTLDGEIVERVRVSPNASNEENRIRARSFQVDMEEGTGSAGDTLTSAELSWSKDGGHTFSTPVFLSMGKVGKYLTRLIHRKLGHARIWTFKLKIHSPRKIIIKGAFLKQYGEA